MKFTAKSGENDSYFQHFYTEVVDWLKAFDPNISIVRINNDLQDVKFKQMIYTHNEKSLWVQTSQGELIDLFKAKVVWYRKGGCMFRNTGIE